MAVSGRLYTMNFNNVSVAAVQDLLALYAGATRMFGVHAVSLGQVTGATVANARLRHRLLPATVTSGSGGAAGVINKTQVGDAAATVTGRVNDTTQATTSGTGVDLVDDVWNTINGYIWYPPIPGRPFLVPLSAAYVISLDTVPATMTVNGSITFEEIG
jgi:hypothetical protein